MNDIKSLIELNELKRNVEAAIERVKEAGKEVSEDVDTRKVLTVALSIIGALVVVVAVAYLVYRYFSNDSLEDDYDIDDLIADDDDSDDDDEPEVIIAHSEIAE